MNEALDTLQETFLAGFYGEPDPPEKHRVTAKRTLTQVRNHQPFIYQESAAWLAA